MRVAVFGSWHNPGSGLRPQPSSEWQFVGSRQAFTAACTEIGRAVAERGHTLIVESDRPDVADVPAVEGYVHHAAAAGNFTLRVELFHPRGEKRPFEDRAAHHQALFRYDALPIADPFQSRWTNSHLVSLKHADAVLTIAGRRGTYQAGYAAIVANKPLVPIASFGGASVDLLRDLKSHHTSLPPAFESLLGPWSQVTLRSALDLASAPDCHQLIDDLTSSGQMRRTSVGSAAIAQRVSTLVATAAPK